MGQDSFYHLAYANQDHKKGELQSVDGYMNIALEKTEEYVNGQLRRSYGDAFVRGNNGMLFRTHYGVDLAKLTEGSTLHFSAIVTKPAPIEGDHLYSGIVSTTTETSSDQTTNKKQNCDVAQQ